MRGLDGHEFHVVQAVCVSTGGPLACVWSSDNPTRLYSEFTVYTRSDFGGVVRSFRLDTRGGHGVPVRAGPTSAGDRHAGLDLQRVRIG